MCLRLYMECVIDVDQWRVYVQIIQTLQIKEKASTVKNHQIVHL